MLQSVSLNSGTKMRELSLRVFILIISCITVYTQTLTCQVCAKSCFYVSGCSESSEGECVPCDSCPIGTYRIGCGGTSSGVCKTCSACPYGEYTIGCSLDYDGGCTPCQPCQEQFWPMYRSACYGLKAGVCKFCNLCTVGYFRSGCNGTSLSEGTCEPCVCPAGQYMVGCSPYSTTPMVCIACEICPARQYMSGCSGASPGTCMNYPVGQYLATVGGGVD